MKVLTVGVFDYFHYGHLKLFERARALGDFLIVAVQRTEEIHKTKPDTKIMYSLEQRMEILSAIRMIDQVIPYSQIAEDIQTIDFDTLAVNNILSFITRIIIVLVHPRLGDLAST